MTIINFIEDVCDIEIYHNAKSLIDLLYELYENHREEYFRLINSNYGRGSCKSDPIPILTYLFCLYDVCKEEELNDK